MPRDAFDRVDAESAGGAGRFAPLTRRQFLAAAGAGTLGLACEVGRETRSTPRPNIIFIMADDLGYGEVGCYGQRKIRTPNIDRLAADGVRFTDHYAGSPVCAPSRCVLLTGLHTGHAYIRDNDEMDERGDVWHDLSLEGQRPLPPGTVTLGSRLQAAGYVTAAIGKWGLGGPGSSGEPTRQGFDHFYGYLCQRIAHNHYPSYLWKDGQKDVLEGNPYYYPHVRLPKDADPRDPASYAAFGGRRYAFDAMLDEALGFVRQNRAKPFFLLFAPTIPHAALQVPEDSLNEYAGAFPETPYIGDKGYLPHRTPRAAYAAMVTRMDRGVGRLMALLSELDLDGRTIVFFTSDNGPTFNGGTDSTFFNSAGPFRGLKASLYEGGIRVPMIARWPGHIQPGRVSACPSAFWDVVPTLTDLAGAAAPNGVDGLSMVPVLTGDETRQPAHEFLYWEFERHQAVRMGQWKALRDAQTDVVELYDLAADERESSDLAGTHPDVVRVVRDALVRARTESALFPLLPRAASSAPGT